MMARFRFAVCALLLAFCFPARADVIGLSTLGDSLTATYAGMPYAGNNASWTDLLATHRTAHLAIRNFAVAGATSADMLAQGQPTAAIHQFQANGVKHVTVAIGANDVGAFLAQLNPSNPATFDPTGHAASLVGNVAATVTELKTAGAKVVLANVPDIGRTPAMQALLAGQPQVQGLLSMLTDAVNAQLKQIASALKVPLVDLHKLNGLSSRGFILGGNDVTAMLYSIDGFHPSSIGSALLANLQLEALRQGYGVEVPQFTTAEILSLQGLQVTGQGSFNAAAFIIQPVPEPSAILLAALGLGAFAWRRSRAAA